MRTVFAIGIGTGNPQHLTVQAIDALQQIDAVLVLDKGSETEDMRQLRRNLLDTHAGTHPRVLTITDTKRDPDLARRDYAAAVARWHHERAASIAAVLREELDDDGVAAFLVWGDPALYDSTLRILDDVRGSGLDLDVQVIPGISAPAALCAAFGILANGVGQPIHLTTGRRLAETAPELLANCFVMLDGSCTFLQVAAPDTEIYWGAYLGDPHREILVHGTVGAVGEDIVRRRAEARAEHGWIMDTYLLRAAAPTPDA